MLDEIEATESGAEAVRQARAQGWRIGYGKPVAGGGFTYPYKRIVLGRGYRYVPTRSMLAHELYHAWRYGRVLVNSIQQEYEAEAFAQRVRYELGAISKRALEAWMGVPEEEHYRRIRSYSAWHARILPDRQPRGLAAVGHAILQGLTIWMSRRGA
jgi:hypothetical protein